MKKQKQLINNMMLVRAIVLLILLAALMMIGQLWFAWFDMVFFWKLLATIVILGLVISFLIAVLTDFSDEKSMKDDQYLD